MPSPNQKNNQKPGSSQLTFALVACPIAICLFASPAATAITTAQRAATDVNLGEIVRAYDTYINASNPARPLPARPGDTAQVAAITLARTTKLNDAIDWFVKSDPKLTGSIPPDIISGSLDSGSINPDFANKTLSFEVAANLIFPPPPIPAPNPANIPVVWTRGLRDDGTWAPDSPWQGEGGFIAFLDGHVSWFNKLTTQPGVETLFIYGTNSPTTNGTPTTNIREALPPNAIILSAEPGPGGM